MTEKPELKYCSGKCQSHTPHIILIQRLHRQKLCLVCCIRSKYNEKQDVSLLEPKCEYCMTTLSFIDGNHKGTNGRRFCRNGRCATNQNKFMKAWRDMSVSKIKEKMKDLRNRIQVDKLYETSAYREGIGFIAIAKRNQKLEPEKIGTLQNQIAMLYNIEKGRVMVVQEIRN